MRHEWNDQVTGRRYGAYGEPLDVVPALRLLPYEGEPEVAVKGPLGDALVREMLRLAQEREIALAARATALEICAKQEEEIQELKRQMALGSTYRSEEGFSVEAPPEAERAVTDAVREAQGDLKTFDAVLAGHGWVRNGRVIRRDEAPRTADQMLEEILGWPEQGGIRVRRLAEILAAFEARLDRLEEPVVTPALLRRVLVQLAARLDNRSDPNAIENALDAILGPEPMKRPITMDDIDRMTTGGETPEAVLGPPDVEMVHLSREDAIREALKDVQPEALISPIMEADRVLIELLLGVPAWWDGGREIREEDFASPVIQSGWKRQHGHHPDSLPPTDG